MSSKWQELVASAQQVCDADTPLHVHAAIGRLRDALGAALAVGEEKSFTVFAGVGFEQGNGHVELTGPELPLTMPVESAERLGGALIAAATVAQMEADLVAELKAMDIEMPTIAGLIVALRRRRGEVQE